MRFDLRAEIIFFVSILLFVFALFYYTRILTRLLKLIGKPRFVSSFPVIAGLLFLIILIVHGIKMIYIYPRLAIAGLDLYNLLVLSFKINFLENLLFLIAGFFTFLTSVIYVTWISR